MKRRYVEYDERQKFKVFEDIKEIFSKGFLKAGPKARRAAPRRIPIFIVGMPRSGSTLIEQVLSMDPFVFAGGETMELADLMVEFGRRCGGHRFPESMRHMDRGLMATLGGTYLRNLGFKAPAASHFVNKLLFNFHLIGFICMAIPGARIVHVRRNPLDSCLSLFSKNFMDQLPFCYDLGELGRYYRQYEKLMSHWEDVLPPGSMHEVVYEDFVADPKGRGKALFRHCGLDWDDGVLDFHTNRRVVHTASAVQVRRPLYLSAVNRWEGLRPYAGELVEALR
jgi:hypothetical protein